MEGSLADVCGRPNPARAYCIASATSQIVECPLCWRSPKSVKSWLRWNGSPGLLSTSSCCPPEGQSRVLALSQDVSWARTRLPSLRSIIPSVLLYACFVIALCRNLSCALSVKLWRLLDVASDEPGWPEQRSDLNELNCLSPRQLGGIERIVAVATWSLVVRRGEKCLT